MLGAALLLQACQHTQDQIAVNSAPAAMPAPAAAPDAFNSVAAEMTSGDVKVYNYDEDPPPAPFTPEGPGLARPAPAGVMADPNVTVYSLDDTVPALPVPPGGVPPLTAPSAPVQPVGVVQLRPPGSVDAGVTVTTNPLQPLASAPPIIDGPPPLAPYMPPGSNGGPAHIYFPHGSARLDADGRAAVESVARRQAEGNAAGLVEVEGHASSRAEIDDPVERRIVNLKMSMDRAFQVSSTLIRSGVPASSIKTTVYGDTKPALQLPGVDGEAASRRVEILTAP